MNREWVFKCLWDTSIFSVYVTAETECDRCGQPKDCLTFEVPDTQKQELILRDLCFACLTELEIMAHEELQPENDSLDD